VDDRVHVLKHGDTFAIIRPIGDIREISATAGLVFTIKNSFLSRSRCGWERIGLVAELFIKDYNAILAVDLMNPDFLLAVSGFPCGQCTYSSKVCGGNMARADSDPQLWELPVKLDFLSV